MKIWQVVDTDGAMYTTLKARPNFLKDGLDSFGASYCKTGFIFPINLRVGQIAEITVNENGTWSYEIEREEGWYFVKHKSRNEVTLWRYKSGEWHYAIGGMVDDYHFDNVKISPTRIPDECII